MLQFSRHEDLKTLQVYVDSGEDPQGKVASGVKGNTVQQAFEPERFGNLSL